MTEPIRRLLRHASCWADPEHGDGRGLRTALGDTTPLSPEGLELALTHLETDATDDAIAAMIASANAAQGGPAGRAHVQLAGNVCVAALRAVAFALAGAPAVSLRPSRRDPALARTIAAAMPEVTLVEALAPSPGDAVHLYGRDETMAAMGPFPDCHVLRFGTGFGVAVVARGRDHDAAANRVAADLVAFDGAGCISPRLVLTEAPHETFDALHEALNRHGDAIPRGT